MSSIIDPRTGIPVNSQNSTEQMGRMIQAIQQIISKVDALTAQQMHMGLFVEYFVQSCLSLKGPDGENMMAINMNQFPEWAEKRTAEIRSEAKAQMEEQRAAAIAAVAAENQSASSTPEINLDDEE